MNTPPRPLPTDPHVREVGPDPLRAGRRLAVTSIVLATTVYVLGWAGHQDEVFSILNVLGLLTALTGLGLRRRSWLAWSALAATVAALLGLGALGRLNGAGILAVMCAVVAAPAAAGAWLAWCGRVAWLPPTLFPPPRSRPAGTATRPRDHVRLRTDTRG